MRALRAILIVIVVVIAAMVGFAWWSGSVYRVGPRAVEAPTGTTGAIDTTKARERGAEIGEKAAEAAGKIQETVAEAAITSKIKAKMALDDNVRARSIDVTTSGSTVTLSGTVRSVDEHDRAVRMTRETNGVTQVVDRLTVRP